MRVRKIAVAFASALASLAIPTAVWLWTFSRGAPTAADDAPFRASAGLLILTPVFAVVGTVWFMVSTWAPRRFGKLTLRSLMALSLVVSLLFGAFAAADGFKIGGLHDVAIFFVLFGVSAFVCL